MKDRLNGQFCVYNHKFILGEGQLVSYSLIAVRRENGTLRFTDYHRYCRTSMNRLQKLTQDGNNRAKYVVKFLNYIFPTYHLSCLDEITSDMVIDYLNAYGMCSLPNDSEKTKRSKESVEKCYSAVFDFCTLLSQDRGAACSFVIDDLYTTENRRDKRGKVVKVKVPKFRRNYKGAHNTILRDMPNSVFGVILNHIAQHHTDLLALVILSAFAGLRPSEACNVRREDSPLGHGLSFQITNGKVESIKIDLANELNLRSDHVMVGGIKKERMQQVPDVFLNVFLRYYNIYMEYMNGRNYEKEYGPLSVNRQGKAITYASYLGRFHKIIRDEITPILLESNDGELVAYGRILLEHMISPHNLRHWFTVQLVLSGVDDVATLMYWRGDKSKESALKYLQNKGEIMRQYQKVNNGIFDYMMWAAAKEHNQN